MVIEEIFVVVPLTETPLNLSEYGLFDKKKRTEEIFATRDEVSFLLIGGRLFASSAWTWTRDRSQPAAVKRATGITVRNSGESFRLIRNNYYYCGCL